MGIKHRWRVTIGMRVHAAFQQVRARWLQLLLPGGLLLLALGAISVAPDWWGHYLRTTAAGVGHHWLPALLFGAGAVTVAALSARGLLRHRSAKRARRDWPEPIAAWLPLWAHIGGLLVLSIAVAVGLGGLLWWALGKPAIHTAAASSTLGPAWTVANTFDAIKIVLSIVAGIGAVVALTVAYRKQGQSEVAERREQNRLFNERFGKATEQLGSDKAAIRLAGVYAIAGLADDWRHGRQTCIEVLCAYLRMPSPEPPLGGTFNDSDLDRISSEQASLSKARFAEESQIRTAIVRVVRDHLRVGNPDDVDRWHRCHFDLSGASFTNLDLSRIVVNENTTLDFSGATFRDGVVDFHGADLLGGEIKFDRATFKGGTLSFNHATIADGSLSFDRVTSAGEFDFMGAELSGGMISFHRAKFVSGATRFQYAKFAGTDVRFWSTSVSGGDLSFSAAQLTGGSIDFLGSKFSGGTTAFGGVSFAGGYIGFHDAVFSGSRVSFARSVFSSSRVQVSHVRFSGGVVDFDTVSFSGCEVDFRDAYFSGGVVDFTGALFSAGVVSFVDAGDWSTPPIGLPATSDFVKLPEAL